MWLMGMKTTIMVREGGNMDIIILFTSYYFATKADTMLTKELVPHNLMATPPELSDVCGLCIRVHPNVVEMVLSLLKVHKMSHSGIFYYEKGIPCQRYEA